MPLDVLTADERGEREAPHVHLSEDIFDALQNATESVGAKLLSSRILHYYGAEGHFRFSCEEAGRAAEELERLLEASDLRDEARETLQQFAALCRHAAHAGLEVRGYPD